MKHVIFGNRNLDAFLAAIITYHKLVYDGEKDILVYPFLIGYIYDNLKSGDTAVFIGVSLHPDKLDELVKEKNVNVVCIEHNKKFVDELDCTFVDWHNMNYMLLSEAATHDIYDKLDFFKTNSPVGWRTYFANNNFSGKNTDTKRSYSGMVRDILLEKDPAFFDFLKTYTGEDIHDLIDLSQEHELILHEGSEKKDSYLLHQWFQSWYEENETNFEYLGLHPNLCVFLNLKVKFTLLPVAEKIKLGKELLHRTKHKTKEIALSSSVKRIRFRHHDIPDMKACYIDNEDVAVLGGNIVGTELVKEHGWDVVVLNGPEQKETVIYFLFSNPDGADIDVANICHLYCAEGPALNTTGKRNIAAIEFIKGDEEMFFKFID